MVISNKKEKPKKEKKKKFDDKKGSVVQNNEVFNKAFDLIKTAEQMEENNYKKPSSGQGSAENRGSNSLSSNDSLIQTQRKLKQEYAVRLSQQNIDLSKIKAQHKDDGPEEEEANRSKLGGKMGSANNPFDSTESNDINVRQKRNLSSSN